MLRGHTGLGIEQEYRWIEEKRFTPVFCVVLSVPFRRLLFLVEVVGRGRYGPEENNGSLGTTTRIGKENSLSHPHGAASLESSYNCAPYKVTLLMHYALGLFSLSVKHSAAPYRIYIPY